ncbi:MAG: glycosyltransferase [Lachnospiraceae bacterium]|nr:glycosyltransferase [Lachnospiraceae bacterium]
MVFVTLFTRLKNVHLLKDVGMIPYMLHRDYNVNSIMVSYKNDESYPYLEKEVKGLKVKFLKKDMISPIIAGAKFVWKNASGIDVLNVYHLNLSSFVYLLIYKLRKKPGGKGYLKLDMDLKGYKRLLMPNPVGFIKRMTIRLADVVSVETTLIAGWMEKKYGPRIIYIPNGFYTDEEQPVKTFNKENMILAVGNLGTYAKATDVLLNAFAGAAVQNDWKLYLVGSIEEEFKTYISSFMARHPDLKDRIIFTGPITDKEKLNEYYRRAKIFTLPSRSESFGIVLLEAAANGDFLVTTKGVPAGRDIYNDGKFGYIVPVDDSMALSGAFVRLMNSKADWESRAVEIADYTWHDFRWDPIVAKLYEHLRQR